MRSKFYLAILFLFSLLLITGCKTASKLYESGDYDEAVELAVKKIQKKKDDQELKNLLQNAYQFAVEKHESKIRSLSQNNNELKWEWTYQEYALLQKMYHAIQNSPEARSVVDAFDYSSYVTSFAEQAADVRFERGMIWMEKNEKQSFRNAYYEFNAALRFQPGDRTIQSKIDEAFQLAVTNVVLMPMDNYQYRYSAYNDFELQNFENDLLHKLKYQGSNQFINFYSDREAGSRNILADQFVDFRFTTMNIGRVREEVKKRVVTKEVVVKETVYKPDSVVREYKKVSATILTTRRIMNSTGNMQVNIRDTNGRWLWSDDLKGNHYWTTEFATYTGDERALSESDKELLKQRRNIPPREDEIMRELFNDINSNLYSRLRNFYNRY